jgi:hypothetical protein
MTSHETGLRSVVRLLIGAGSVAMLLMLGRGCESVEYRQYDYASAEATVGDWRVGTGLEGTWVQVEGPDQHTVERRSPYRIWIWLRGVPSSAQISFEDVVLRAIGAPEPITVDLGPPEWSEGPEGEMAQAVTVGLDLDYQDYVLSARIVANIDSTVVERFVELPIDRAYVEQERNRQLERLRG